jgi:hypothetical protein
LAERLPNLTAAFQGEGIIASWTVIDAASFGENLAAGMEALGGAFFKPNALFLPMPDGEHREQEVRDILATAADHRVGVLLFADDPVTGLGRRHAVNLWVEDRSPDWKMAMDLGNQDLALLIAYKLKLNWKADLRINAVVEDAGEVEAARDYLTNLTDLARLPNAQTRVYPGVLEEALTAAPVASLNIFSLTLESEFAPMRNLVEKARSACLFAMDSGDENALA